MFAIVIVDYNTIEDTLKYIEQSILKIQSTGKLHFVIVDNGNRTDTKEKIHRAYGDKNKIDYICEKEVEIFELAQTDVAICYAQSNLGYAKGNNLGLKVSEKLFGNNYALISNNDIIVQDIIELDEIERIFEQNKNIAVIGPRIIGRDGKVQNPHRYISSYKDLLFYYWSMALLNCFRNYLDDVDYKDKSGYCDWVMGCFTFLDCRKVKEVGYFDENTFLYYEEQILSKKLERHKYTNYYYKDITVIHNHGATVKKNVSRLTNVRITFNSACYYYQNYRGVSAKFICLAKANFIIYTGIYKFKQMIKRMIKY